MVLVGSDHTIMALLNFLIFLEISIMLMSHQRYFNLVLTINNYDTSNKLEPIYIGTTFIIMKAPVNINIPEN